MTAQAGGASSLLPPSPMISLERDRVRREMRAQRAALTAAARKAAAASFAAIAMRAHLLRPGLRVAFYVAHRNEADPVELIERARRLGCEVFLPVITDFRSNRMHFARYPRGGKLVPNRYGIAEPAGARLQPTPVRTLDVVFLPLVAVDERGWRLGSGAGYYDRCLAHLRPPRHWRRPKLIGLAYEFQRIAHLTPAPWDVPLDAVLTEKDCYRIPRQEI